jgi:hypothetical protein
MSLRHVSEEPGTQVPAPPKRVGHAHFWERAMSRRTLFGAAAGAAGAVVGSGVLGGRSAWAGGADPKPIPGGLTAGGVGWHLFLPGEGAEPSTITDLNGVVGLLDVTGEGVGRQGGVEAPFPFETDVRFIQGRYIAVDGRLRFGTFAFI